ncbi:hypothetical protein CSIV_14310 [Microbacterium sp. CSI-V]|uniref:hypothetical protein n=1 Tax=Microbacterium sp. CSI-V TaxID=1933777 RepID=UPI00097BFA38|nr:hypothetical protein [Microbacterium sp. CSI-V]ONI62644.1 hypothetical protein CSIV_14310 [Microbacterium sp. CSI-V]
MDEQKKTAYLDSLQSAALRLEDLEADIRSFATIARENGASWTDVGDALGVSRQAAQQRFGR